MAAVKFSEDGPSLNLTDSQFLLVSLSFKMAENCNAMIPATFCEKLNDFPDLISWLCLSTSPLILCRSFMASLFPDRKSEFEIL